MSRGELPEITVETVSELPPDNKRGRSRSKFYTEVAVKARKNPAEWVVLKGYKSAAIASHMRNGKYPAINPDDHEIECRRESDGTYSLYLKYVGKIV